MNNSMDNSISALQAKTVAKTARSLSEMARKESTDRFLNEEVFPLVRKFAEKGEFETCFDINLKEHDVKYIIASLANLGYEVLRHGNIIKISWE